MKNKIIFLLCVWASFLLPPAHAQDTAADITVPNRGTLYRIRHHGNTTYLFGTIHVGLPSFFPLEPQLMHALTHAQRLVVELDPRNDEAMQEALRRHGMYDDGDSIDRHLSHAAVTQLQRAMASFDIPYERAARMKPWLVTNLLISLNLERHGYQRSQGIELFLLAVADQKKIAVQELESADYQMALFDSMTESEQEQYLIENLAQLDDGDALKQDVALINAWAHAKGSTFEDMLRATLEGKPASAEFTQRILLDKRNPPMANKIAALLDEDGSSFVAVGSLHLIGKNGVPNLLRQKGYVVEKLY
jgi:uncharacterized protein YbaP (TraB family)